MVLALTVVIIAIAAAGSGFFYAKGLYDVERGCCKGGDSAHGSGGGNGHAKGLGAIGGEFAPVPLGGPRASRRSRSRRSS